MAVTFSLFVVNFPERKRKSKKTMLRKMRLMKIKGSISGILIQTILRIILIGKRDYYWFLISISPRTLAAFKRTGIRECDLKFKHMEMVRKEKVPVQFLDDKDFFYEMKYNHHEERRKARLKKMFKALEKIKMQHQNSREKTLIVISVSLNLVFQS